MSVVAHPNDTDRYLLRSDMDGFLCLLAPVGTPDWNEWRVTEVHGDGRREPHAPEIGFFGYVTAEANWFIDYREHLEVEIPGLQKFVLHGFQVKQCPICGYTRRGG